ncbi:hypothetical protein [Sphingopyxis sp.]|uniref:hypothetical protein n=1 Tax=Sphingopyxis sp. TaxID=1908224 RepID=UPI003D6D4749
MRIMRWTMIATIAAGLVAAPAAAREADKVLMSEHPQGRAFQEAVGYADAVIAGDTIYLSGVVAGMAKGETDLAPGYDRAFKAIAATLARAGRAGTMLSTSRPFTPIWPRISTALRW